MAIPIQNVIYIMLGVAAYLAVLFMIDRALAGRRQAIFRYLALAATIVAFFYGLNHFVSENKIDDARVADITKALLALAAASAVFYEQQRAAMRRPIAERWKKFLGITLGIAAIVTYFHAFKWGYPRYYHRWDQYHYYMGAKYFPEMGYDRLYKCTLIAQDEIGTVSHNGEDHIGQGTARLDMTKEVRHADKKIRNLGGDNLLIPVTDILAHPEICKSHFSAARWESYKQDVTFFRIASDKQYWEDMQRDHGFNPPPVWTVAGYYLSNLHPACTWYLQLLGALDPLYLGLMFLAIAWAFGWRIFAVAAIFWGCQSPAPSFWTLGAFLRQDWLFYLVLSTCLTRKRYYGLAGASMVYAALLRVFPGLAVIGWLVVAGVHFIKHRSLTKPQWRMILGGTLAAALLIPLSVKVAGRDSYSDFYKHTLEVHDQTPLTNHMGLRVLIAQKLPFEIQIPPVAMGGMEQGALFKLGTGMSSGRMKYTTRETDPKALDPFENWKRLRNDRYKRYKPVAYAIIALTLAFFVYVVRRVKSLWIAQCLAQIFLILLSQLTCYYYSFMVLLAPLTRVNRELEAPLFGYLALSQIVFIVFYYNDDRYWMLTAIALGLSYIVLYAYLPNATKERIERALRLRRAPPLEAKSAPSSN